ncbi:MAG: bifunctional folylpolyglutamate synthase/dihydrofolate synthase [Eubacterium sp.]
MNYNDALNLILNKQSLGIMPGLMRIKKLLDKMDNPQDKLKIIHIAGTNGKGTVAASIADALIQNGQKTGLFSSPWVLDYREQIQVNNEFIPEEVFAGYVDEYKNNDCTEFEFLTAIMYKYFADECVDYAVIECGMGGKNDSTNVEKTNVCSVITHIAIDHTKFLGDTIQLIAQEKSGIIRQGSPCILYPNPDVNGIFDKFENVIRVKDANDYMINNLETASAALKVLGINSPVSISSLPARQERINGILIDGGHNVDAAKALENVINNEIAVIGMMKDKNVDGYLSVIAPKCKRIIVTTPNNSRSMPANDLKTIAQKYCDDVIVIDNPANAVSQKNISLICGSFYLAREIRNLIL